MGIFKIDSHIHITPPEIIDGWEKYAQKEDHFKLLSLSPKNKFATAEDVIKELDENGIDRAVVFGFAFKDQGLCKEVNSYVLESLKRHPERLLGFACINPRAKGLEQELGRCFDAGMIGVGELFPDGQGFEIADQEQVSNLTSLCTERGFPLLLHINEPIGHYYSGKTKTSIKEAYIFAENNPKLKIIYAHFGGGLWSYELMPEVKKVLANVYYDSAAGPLLYNADIYKAFLVADVSHKILFGSDYPLLPIKRHIKDFQGLHLEKNTLDAILGGNATELLKLKV